MILCQIDEGTGDILKDSSGISATEKLSARLGSNQIDV